MNDGVSISMLELQKQGELELQNVLVLFSKTKKVFFYQIVSYALSRGMNTHISCCCSPIRKLQISKLMNWAKGSQSRE